MATELGVTERVKTALAQAPLDAIIVTGLDHVGYLTGAPLTYLVGAHDQRVLVFWPKTGQPQCICPAEWAPVVRSLGRIPCTCGYPATGGEQAPIEALSCSVRAALPNGGRVGIDLARAPAAFSAWLRTALPDVEWVACDDWLRSLRMVKTAPEIAALADIAARTDHGIVGAAHHVIVQRFRTETAQAEEIRMTCCERLLDTVGHHAVAQVAGGENAKQVWPQAPKYSVGGGKPLSAGEWVRMEMIASRDNYWSDACRMMVMGQPTPEQAATYAGLVALRGTALEHLRPGVRASEIYAAVDAESRRLSVDLIREIGVGHGIGASSMEPPYLTGADHTTLAAGMVLVLDLAVRAPTGEIVRTKDTVIIAENGAGIVGWYKDWREPYLPIYDA
jgi:Xaa-Pro aminopeptidase